MFCILFLVFVVSLTDATATAGGCSFSCSSGSSPFLGQTSRSLIRQCTFNKISEGKDVGEIRTCDFAKVSDNTALRATFQGDIRMVGCTNSRCCRRWFLTFNGKECSSPAPIDAVIYTNAVAINLHRPGTLDGFCENIPKGRVVVGLSVGDCKHASHPNGDAHTGWNSVARLIIEEVPPLQ